MKKIILSAIAKKFARYNFQIYEGDRAMCKDNHFLGEFKLTGIPPAPMKKEKIVLTYEINANGILNVTANCKSNGNQVIFFQYQYYWQFFGKLWPNYVGLKSEKIIQLWSNSFLTRNYWLSYSCWHKFPSFLSLFYPGQSNGQKTLNMSLKERLSCSNSL